MLVPQIIHQTWKNDDVPSQLSFYQTAWQSLHPGWAYYFWTDDISRQFLSIEYPWFLPVYDHYDMPIKRVDVMRYFWMYHFGGVYVDLDIEPIHPLDQLLSRITEPSLMMVREPLSHCQLYDMDFIVSNAFIISTPKHPVWLDILVALVERHNWVDPLKATGPFFLTDLFQDSPTFRSALRLLKPDVINPFSKFETWSAANAGTRQELRQHISPETVAIHHWLGSWWREPSEIKLDS